MDVSGPKSDCGVAIGPRVELMGESTKDGKKNGEVRGWVRTGTVVRDGVTMQVRNHHVTVTSKNGLHPSLVRSCPFPLPCLVRTDPVPGLSGA